MIQFRKKEFNRIDYLFLNTTLIIIISPCYSTVIFIMYHNIFTLKYYKHFTGTRMTIFYFLLIKLYSSYNGFYEDCMDSEVETA